MDEVSKKNFLINQLQTFSETRGNYFMFRGNKYCYYYHRAGHAKESRFLPFHEMVTLTSKCRLMTHHRPRGTSLSTITRQTKSDLSLIQRVVE